MTITAAKILALVCICPPVVVTPMLLTPQGRTAVAKTMHKAASRLAPVKRPAKPVERVSALVEPCQPVIAVSGLGGLMMPVQPIVPTLPVLTAERPPSFGWSGPVRVVTRWPSEGVPEGGAVGPMPVPPPVAGVPDPATWALMLSGFAVMGGVMRVRRGMAAR